MAEFVTIADPAAGPDAVGRVRVDRRSAETPGDRPPLVVLAGMTQTLTSWSAQARAFAKTRDVLVYEARGQGQTELSLSDTSLARHVDDFARVIAAAGLRGPVDLSGFSFGGRVALAVAAERPELVRRLVLTGVGSERSAVGRAIVRGWIAALETGDLHTLGWVSLADTLGEAYLAAHESGWPEMVEAVARRNRVEGIRALLAATLELAPDDPFAVRSLIPKLRCPTLCIGGQSDRVADPESVRELAELLGARVRIVDGVGHTVAIENREVWLAEVLAFLDQPGPRAG